MNDRPAVKFLAFGSSVLVFSALNFILAAKTVFGCDQLLLHATGYFFGVVTDSFDYLTLALIPIVALLMDAKNSLRGIFIENIKIAISASASFCLGLIMLIWIGKPVNPLIPQYLLTEPFRIYSAIFIGTGVVFPLVFKNIRKPGKL